MVIRMSTAQSTQNKMYPMNFSESKHASIVIENLRMQKDSRKFCDVVIYVENKKFYLHRNVLSAFSPYFESVFQTRKSKREVFNVTCQSAETFECFVNYMYDGAISIDKENVAEMLNLAHRLEVTKLKLYCADYLEKYLDLSNCLAVKEMADKYNMPLLSKLTTEFIQNHLSEVLSGLEILKLDVFKLEKFLSDEAFGLTQVQIMQVIIKWTKEDVLKREKQLKSILKLIKWMEIDIQHINDIIENENLFVISEISLYLMLTHLNENGLTFAKFHSVLDVLNKKYSHLQSEKETESLGTIKEVKMDKKKLRKRQRLLRANPIARLAALRSALVLRTRRYNSETYLSGRKLDKAENDSGNVGSALRCHLCDHHSSDTTSLEQHLSIVHSRDVTYKCGICGYVCQWNNLYIQHIKGHFPGPPYKCDTCEFTSDTLNSVLTHRSAHVHEKIHRCLHCSFRSESQASLLIHSKCHLTRLQPKRKNVHITSERTYVCDLCGFSTKYLSHLVAHKRIHSGDTYRCSYPHCKYTTAKKSQLMSHTKSHQGVRPHCCNVCGRGFLEKSHLVRHERIHLEEKPFKCHECDYASSRRDKLKEHQARHHGDRTPLSEKPFKAKRNKKPNQLLQENISDSTGMRIHESTVANEVQDVLSQNHNLTGTNLNTYVTFTTNETQVHNSTVSPSLVTSTAVDFHHSQPINSVSIRVKDNLTSGMNHRITDQSSAAVVAAAMVLDPRLQNNTSTGSYVAPAVSVATVVNQSAVQVVQAGPQVAEYSIALMSLF